MTILLFQKRRTELKEILSSNANLNSRRYFRLMALAAVQVVCSFPLTLALLCINATSSEISPWISWEDTHFGTSFVTEGYLVLDCFRLFACWPIPFRCMAQQSSNGSNSGVDTLARSCLRLYFLRLFWVCGWSTEALQDCFWLYCEVFDIEAPYQTWNLKFINCLVWKFSNWTSFWPKSLL